MSRNQDILKEYKEKRIGEKSYNNFGSEMIIIEYRNKNNIDVLFPKYNYIKKHIKYSNFKNGLIKCPYEPRVFGVGYDGEGEIEKESYKTWKGMLERCYSPYYINEHLTYIDCFVCKKWHNYQNYKIWHKENYYKIKNQTMCLDKDILIKGNKIYSPQTCIFVPQNINKLFVSNKSQRGKYPIGVCTNKTKPNKYFSMVNKKEENFKDVHNTFLWYKINKELYIESIANEYKKFIPNKLYFAMINYKIEIDD